MPNFNTSITHHSKLILCFRKFFALKCYTVMQKMFSSLSLKKSVSPQVLAPWKVERWGRVSVLVYSRLIM